MNCHDGNIDVVGGLKMQVVRYFVLFNWKLRFFKRRIKLNKLSLIPLTIVLNFLFYLLSFFQRTKFPPLQYVTMVVFACGIFNCVGFPCVYKYVCVCTVSVYLLLSLNICTTYIESYIPRITTSHSKYYVIPKQFHIFNRLPHYKKVCKQPNNVQ